MTRERADFYEHSYPYAAGQGDLQVRDRALDMKLAARRVFERAPGVDRAARARPPQTYQP